MSFSESPKLKQNTESETQTLLVRRIYIYTCALGWAMWEDNIDIVINNAAKHFQRHYGYGEIISLFFLKQLGGINLILKTL